MHGSSERQSSRIYQSIDERGSRTNLANFLGLPTIEDRDAAGPETRRETKQEREARKLEKERVAREKERERSMREEHVDGGYLVTQGVYTGPEDYGKIVVRRLMVITSSYFCICMLMNPRLNVVWHHSGEACRIMRIRGQNINS